MKILQLLYGYEFLLEELNDFYLKWKDDLSLNPEKFTNVLKELSNPTAIYAFEFLQRVYENRANGGFPATWETVEYEAIIVQWHPKSKAEIHFNHSEELKQTILKIFLSIKNESPPWKITLKGESKSNVFAHFYRDTTQIDDIKLQYPEPSFYIKKLANKKPNHLGVNQHVFVVSHSPFTEKDISQTVDSITFSDINVLNLLIDRGKFQKIWNFYYNILDDKNREIWNPKMFFKELKKRGASSKDISISEIASKFVNLHSRYHVIYPWTLLPLPTKERFLSEDMDMKSDYWSYIHNRIKSIIHGPP